MESQRVRHNLATEQQNSTSATLMHRSVLKHAKYMPISGPLRYPSQNQSGHFHITCIYYAYRCVCINRKNA